MPLKFLHSLKINFYQPISLSQSSGRFQTYQTKSWQSAWRSFLSLNYSPVYPFLVIIVLIMTIMIGLTEVKLSANQFGLQASQSNLYIPLGRLWLCCILAHSALADGLFSQYRPMLAKIYRRIHQHKMCFLSGAIGVIRLFNLQSWDHHDFGTFFEPFLWLRYRQRIEGRLGRSPDRWFVLWIIHWVKQPTSGALRFPVSFKCWDSEWSVHVRPLELWSLYCLRLLLGVKWDWSE